jgi:hypothetical protein
MNMILAMQISLERFFPPTTAFFDELEKMSIGRQRVLMLNHQHLFKSYNQH